jgi:2-oxoglutarate dehydrogenase E2 component (dihydrolipoamide succinyltransferase)
MKQPVEVPQVGESVTSGILAVWNVSNGDYVNEGDELFELETDKATLPVPATASGVISITVQADTEVEIGTVVAEIDTEAKAGSGAAKDAASGGGWICRVRHRLRKLRGWRLRFRIGGLRRAPAAEAVSPAVRRILDENGLSAAAVAAAVAPTGKDGRLTKGT